MPNKLANDIELQNNEFKAAAYLATMLKQHDQTAVVDDDYPAVRRMYEVALGNLISAMAANGRFRDGSPLMNLVRARGAATQQVDELSMRRIRLLDEQLAERRKHAEAASVADAKRGAFKVDRSNILVSRAEFDDALARVVRLELQLGNILAGAKPKHDGI